MLTEYELVERGEFALQSSKPDSTERRYQLLLRPTSRVRASFKNDMISKLTVPCALPEGSTYARYVQLDMVPFHTAQLVPASVTVATWLPKGVAPEWSAQIMSSRPPAGVEGLGLVGWSHTSYETSHVPLDVVKSHVVGTDVTAESCF